MYPLIRKSSAGNVGHPGRPAQQICSARCPVGARFCFLQDKERVYSSQCPAFESRQEMKTWQKALLLCGLAGLLAIGALFYITRQHGAPGETTTFSFHPKYLTVGSRQIGVCASLTPNMVGSELDLGPVSITRLHPWTLQLQSATQTNPIKSAPDPLIPVKPRAS